MIYIRADGNCNIGMGHVMRCLSVAEASYNWKNIKPIFIMADDGCKELVSDRGFDSIVLGTDYTDMESEISQLTAILQKDDIILVDSYQVTQMYYCELGKLCHTACLEDMGNPYPVDLLINYNIYGPKLREKYENCQYRESLPGRVVLGTKYMPLRECFRNGLEYEVRSKATDVMVTTGGSDPLYAAGAVLGKISLIEGIKIHVVSGPFNKNAKRLKSDYGNTANIEIHENIKDMKALMKKCDIVVTATGSTVYEVSALGVPMICFCFAENQKQGAKELGLHTDIVNAGCFADDSYSVVNGIYDTLLRCIGDYEYRKTLHEQEKRLIDGKGAYRIVDELLKELSENDGK